MAQFRKVLAEWNCTGYVTAKEVARNWIASNVGGLDLKAVAKAMHDFMVAVSTMPEPDTHSEIATSAASRPFPWYCPNCRRKEVRRVTIPYRCQMEHNGQP